MLIGDDKTQRHPFRGNDAIQYAPSRLREIIPIKRAVKSPNRDKSGQITEIANNFIGGGPSDNQIHSRQRRERRLWEKEREENERERERERSRPGFRNPLERRWRFSLSSIPRRSFSLFWRSSGCVSVCTFSCDTPCYRLHCKCATHSAHSQTHRRTTPERATFYGEIGRVCEFDAISRPASRMNHGTRQP